MITDDRVRDRKSSLDMDPEEFRRNGHRLVDRIADFLASMPSGKVTSGEKPAQIRNFLGNSSMPENGTPAETILDETADLLFHHSLFNGHPRFMGYITASGAPIGMLGDLLAAAVNPNAGAWTLSPMASEIELQTVQWIAESIGYPVPCGGILVSGGTMANFVGFLAGRRAKTEETIRTKGLLASGRQMVVYASEKTHTWIHKAADLFGLGIDCIRWIPVDDESRMIPDELEKQIMEDRKNGVFPLMVVGTAGTVETGAVDPLDRIAEICREHNLWFHVDGAYGAPAAMLPEASPQLKALREADSLAVDPHKWFYSVLEAGCTLVRNPQHLIDAFSFHPEYYKFDPDDEETKVNFYEWGFQNSRGFLALKVWLALRQAGRSGYIQMIREDIRLAEHLFQKIQEYPELEVFTQNLSIATFRYRPVDLTGRKSDTEEYLNELNNKILERLQAGGDVFISNAVINGKFLLRACIVNFRTTRKDVEAVPEIVARLGREVDSELRPAERHKRDISPRQNT